jgi:histidyl-tRNA synthetase
VFEWTTDQLGAQAAVCSGGRYDGLVELLGGKPTPAIGWGLGIERLIALLEVQGRLPEPETPHAYLVLAGEEAVRRGQLLAEQWRAKVRGLRLLVNLGGGGIKAQFKRADRSGAEIALVLGDDEIAANEITLKFLREERGQQRLGLADVTGLLTQLTDRTANQ